MSQWQHQKLIADYISQLYPTVRKNTPGTESTVPACTRLTSDDIAPGAARTRVEVSVSWSVPFFLLLLLLDWFMCSKSQHANLFVEYFCSNLKSKTGLRFCKAAVTLIPLKIDRLLIA